MFSFKHILPVFLFLALAFSLPHLSTGTVGATIPRSAGATASSVRIQIGFGNALNYDYVAENSQVAGRIMSLLPRAITYGLAAPESDVAMDNLVPLQRGGYVATVARVYVPAEKAEQLRSDLARPGSRLYTNPDEQTRQLTAHIDPSIPFDV